MAYYSQWWLASLATSVVVALQAPPSPSVGAPPAAAWPGGNQADGAMFCGDPTEEVAQEMEALGLAWPRHCTRSAGLGGGRRAPAMGIHLHQALGRARPRRCAARGAGPGGGRRAPVLWIHLHKAAGSTMCALARLNGETLPQGELNCNWLPYDGLGGKGATCSERLQVFREQAVSWGAIERGLFDGDFCPGFDYALLLRDPAALALSFITYHYYSIDDIHKSMACVQSGDCRVSVTGVEGRENKGHGDTVYLWYYMDNFVVRMLGGQEARDAPPGKLEERHYDKALDVVKRMKVVLLLKELGTAEFSRAFGWSNLPEVHENPSDPGRKFSEADVEEIKRLNGLDYRLFEYVSSIPLPDRVQPIPCL